MVDLGGHRSLQRPSRNVPLSLHAQHHGHQRIQKLTANGLEHGHHMGGVGDHHGISVEIHAAEVKHSADQHPGLRTETKGEPRSMLSGNIDAPTIRRAIDNPQRIAITWDQQAPVKNRAVVFCI